MSWYVYTHTHDMYTHISYIHTHTYAFKYNDTFIPSTPHTHPTHTYTIHPASSVVGVTNCSPSYWVLTVLAFPILGILSIMFGKRLSAIHEKKVEYKYVYPVRCLKYMYVCCMYVCMCVWLLYGKSVLLSCMCVCM